MGGRGGSPVNGGQKLTIVVVELINVVGDVVEQVDRLYVSHVAGWYRGRDGTYREGEMGGLEKEGKGDGDLVKEKGRGTGQKSSGDVMEIME